MGYLENTFDTIIGRFSPKNRKQRKGSKDHSFVRESRSPTSRDRERVASGRMSNSKEEERNEVEGDIVCERCMKESEKRREGEKKKEEFRE